MQMLTTGNDITGGTEGERVSKQETPSMNEGELTAWQGPVGGLGQSLRKHLVSGHFKSQTN